MKFGMVGEHVEHRFEAMVHSFFGLEDYELKSIPLYELTPFFQRGEFQGVSFAAPYKGVIRRFCTDLDETAGSSDWVNTVVRKNGGVTGYNTNLTAMLRMLEHSAFDFAGKKVLIVGESGDERTAAACARQLGAGEVAVFSRKQPGAAGLRDHTDADYIVNATGVGLYPANIRAPLSLELFPGCRGVVESISNPLKTMLWLDAEARGIPCIGGLRIVANHCAVTTQLFTGRAVSRQEVDDAVHHLVRHLTNIVLIGLPGAGKTEIGRVLARRLNRGFLDINTILQQTAGQEQGQTGDLTLREREAQAIRRAGRQHGKIIAVGSGAVPAESNYPPLRQNSVIFYLERDLETRLGTGREIVSPREYERMYTLNHHRFLRYADRRVYNQGSAEECADEILEKYEAWIKEVTI